MQKPSRHIIQFVCIMAVLTAIALQGFTHVVKMKPLEGVVAKEKVVELNFNNYLDGSYQAYLAEHAKRNTGFREFAFASSSSATTTKFAILSSAYSTMTISLRAKTASYSPKCISTT